MIRFAWLQSRAQGLFAIAGLALVALCLLLTGPGLAHLYDTMIAPCAAQGCAGTTTSAFLRTHNDLGNWLHILVLVVPGILGVFWGAPLVARELETGTYRLAWTQGVMRTRWLAVKLAVILAASMAVAGLLSLMATWWNRPLDRVAADAFSRFDARDIVPIGYAAFGLALGVAAGMLMRRTLPAMATVAAVFTATRVGMTHWVRPHLLSPSSLVTALDPQSTGFGRINSGPDTLQPAGPRLPNAWIVSNRIVDGVGRALTPDVVSSTCPRLNVDQVAPPVGGGTRTKAPAAVESALQDCVSKIGAKYHVLTSYHPANSYWAFQWYELAIYLAGTAALAVVCLWALRHRRS